MITRLTGQFYRLVDDKVVSIAFCDISVFENSWPRFAHNQVRLLQRLDHMHANCKLHSSTSGYNFQFRFI
jgi:hypothetical protein